MIPYAGQEVTNEPKRSTRLAWNYPQQVPRRERALMMFRAGKDTAFIAAHFKLSEALMLRWITEARCREHRLPSPYIDGETA